MGVEMGLRDGAEIRIETGEGVIKEINGSGRNVQVVMHATHTALKDPITGWLDTYNEHARDVAQQAHAEGRIVAYRIEVRRKGAAPPDVPIAKLGNREKIRDLVTLELLAKRDGDPKAPGEQLAENIATGGRVVESNGSGQRGEIPPATAPPVAQEPRDEAPAPDAAPAQDEPATGRPEAAAPELEVPPPPAPARKGPKVVEAKPWEPTNSDGSLNLGSYEVQAAAGMASLAYDLWARRRAELREPPAPIPGPKVKGLARHLLETADEVQRRLRSDGRADRMDNSHARARGAVRSALDTFPPPWDTMGTDGHREAVAAWRENLAAEGEAILRAGIDLILEEGPR